LAWPLLSSGVDPPVASKDPAKWSFRSDAAGEQSLQKPQNEKTKALTQHIGIITAPATFPERPDVVLKGEYHWTRSQVPEILVRPVGPAARPVNYGIVSMSISFQLTQSAELKDSNR
jgi:hypothetical protein